MSHLSEMSYPAANDSQVSGVPMSEKKYDKKYGDDKNYQEWKKNTPMFIPKL